MSRARLLEQRSPDWCVSSGRPNGSRSKLFIEVALETLPQLAGDEVDPGRLHVADIRDAARAEMQVVLVWFSGILDFSGQRVRCFSIELGFAPWVGLEDVVASLLERSHPHSGFRG